MRGSVFNIPSSPAAFLCRVVVIAVLFGSIPNPNHGLCDENFGTGMGEIKRDNPTEKNESDFNIGAWLASFFSEHISAVDGDRCPSTPTCSSYSAQAFKKHGFFVGWAMTVDRLIHEGDEGDISPLEKGNGRHSIIDPVENNDFWWYSKDGKD